MERTKLAGGAVHYSYAGCRTAPRFSRTITWIILLLLSSLTAGCITLDDPETAQDQAGEIIASLQPGDTFTQDFVSRRPGLSQITLFLSGTSPDNSQLWLNVNLQEQGAESKSPVSVRLVLPQSSNSFPLNIKIPLQRQSAGHAYRLQISIESGELQIYGRHGDQYPYGRSYLSSSSLEADASFRTAYYYDAAILLNDLSAALPHLWLALPFIAVLILPGWSTLVLLGLNRRFQLPETLSLSIGLSLAIFPVLMAWTSAAGIPWSRLLLVALLSLLVLGAVFRARTKGSNDPQPYSEPHSGPPAMWTAIILGAILLGSLLVRFLMIRNVSAPPWVDSVHHGLITRLIMETGGFPRSYAPYLDITPTAYHPGFHSVLAAFLWLSNLDIVPGMLYLGQVLNAISPLAVYLLAVTLTRDRSVGLAAALVAGFFTPMPAYYTSWGRYPHLAGLIILVAAFALIAATFDSLRGISPTKKLNRSLVFSASLAAAGLFITHYRVAFFLIALLAAYWAVWLIAQSRLKLRPFELDASQTNRLALPSILAAGWCAVAGTILALPWLLPAVHELLLPKLTAWRGVPVAAFSDFTWSYLTAAHGLWAMRIAALGLGIGLLRRQTASLLLPLWVALMLLLANLDVLGLPGSGLINDASVTITLFMPIAVAAGLVVGGLNAAVLAYLPGKLKPAYAALLVLSGAAISIFTARSLIPLLNPVTFLYRQEDDKAIQWVAENTSPDETILINPFAWGYGSYAGQDGAYWISALAGRPTIPPPVLYGLGNSSLEITELNEEIQQFIDQASNPSALREQMRAKNIRLLVTGRRGGIFSPQLLLESGAFRSRLQLNGVWVLETAFP